MDLKQLFHNPDDLDDSELAVMRGKIRRQQYLPYYSFFIGGLAYRVFDATVLKKKAGSCPIRTSGCAIAGFLLGAYGASTMQQNLWREFDRDILKAREQKYLRVVLNTAGYNNNWVSMHHQENFP